MSLYKQNHVSSVKTSTQIDLNRTHLKEFVNINIYINVYIQEKKRLKFFEIRFKKKKIFFNPVFNASVHFLRFQKGNSLA